MSMIDKKISARLEVHTERSIVEELIDNATSSKRFDSVDDLLGYIAEGAILTVGEIASESLGIRPGQYLIWQCDDEVTTLTDMAASTKKKISTDSLLQSYTSLSKNITEESEDSDKEPEFSLAIDRDTVDRTSLLAGMERSGHTVTSLAKAVGVDPPAISRILRKPRKGRTDPGGRNPSLGLAAQVCDELKVPVTKAFSDIFGKKSEYKPKSVKGNSQSGQNKGLKKERGL
jgi:transcriptional regulator with XRE-family HTH domain